MRQTEPRDELEVVRSIENAYAEAADLLKAGYPEMAVVRAVSAFEIFLKRAFLEPYLRTSVLGDQEVADILVRAVIDDAQRWKERLAPLLRTLWGIEVTQTDLWRDMGRAWRARNEIVHEGITVPLLEAKRHVESCPKMTKMLLLARAGSSGRG